MAEAIVNTRLGGEWQAFSAGTVPTGNVHPLALRVLEEIGIHHNGRSKSADEFRNSEFDLVVTVCDDAAENCPIWLGKGKRAHISFVDPAKASGDEQQVLAVFRRVRDEITGKIPAFLMEQ